MCLPPGTRLLAESERPLLISEPCKTVSGLRVFSLSRFQALSKLRGRLLLELNVLHSKAAVIGGLSSQDCLSQVECRSLNGPSDPQDEQSNPPGISSGVVPAVTVVELFRASLRTEWAGPGRRFCYGRTFFFLIFKKIKISKIYVRFENFKNTPRSPYGGDRP